MLSFVNHRGESYTGFVYIWKNTKKNKFYIGSHIGHIDDGYTGSGIHFKNAYKSEKEFFRRKILSYVNGEIDDLLIVEEAWLNLVKDEEMKGVKYYNRTKCCRGLHPLSRDSRAKISIKKKGSTPNISPEIREMRRATMLGNTYAKGTKHTEEWKKANSERHAGKIVPQDVREKISETMTGEKYSEERIANSKAALAELDLVWANDGNQEFKIDRKESLPDGVSHGRLERLYYTNGIENRRFLLNEEIPEGWFPGIAEVELKVYNDGVKQYRCRPENKQPHWVEGRLFSMLYYNNGVEDKLCVIDAQPDGWVLGALPKKKKFYNNGIEGKTFVPGTEPEGWVRGKPSSWFDTMRKKPKQFSEQ